MTGRERPRSIGVTAGVHRAPLLALGACALLSCACASIPRRGEAHLAPGAGVSWQQALREDTRRVEPYDYAVRTADLRATLVTPRLRKAYLDARAELHGQIAAQLERELVGLGNPDEGVDAPMRARPGAEEQVVVFVAFYSSDQKDRDLAIKASIWDARLERGGVSEKPSAIETVPNTPAAARIFPYIDRFDDLYIFRFPLVDAQGHSFLTAGGDPLRFTVKSALADAEVEWSLVE